MELQDHARRRSDEKRADAIERRSRLVRPETQGKQQDCQSLLMHTVAAYAPTDDRWLDGNANARRSMNMAAEVGDEPITNV